MYFDNLKRCVPAREARPRIPTRHFRARVAEVLEALPAPLRVLVPVRGSSVPSYLCPCPSATSLMNLQTATNDYHNATLPARHNPKNSEQKNWEAGRKFLTIMVMVGPLHGETPQTGNKMDRNKQTGKKLFQFGCGRTSQNHRNNDYLCLLCPCHASALLGNIHKFFNQVSEQGTR